MLTPAGQKRGIPAVVKELDAWHKKNLSKYKWLRGGIQVVDEVYFFFRFPKLVPQLVKLMDVLL